MLTHRNALHLIEAQKEGCLGKTIALLTNHSFNVS